MPFPSTKMPGHVEVRGRIDFALNQCQERPSLDFKESQPWAALRWRLLKTIMGMANLRDGGLVVVGVAEQGNAWQLTGIESDHLNSFESDVIADQLRKYASPHVAVDIVTHETDGKQYLAFRVHPFTESPVICQSNSPDCLSAKDRFFESDIFVRPSSGRPRTQKVTNAAQLHDLLELAAEFRARRMLETGRRIGLSYDAPAAARYDAEIADAP